MLQFIYFICVAKDFLGFTNAPHENYWPSIVTECIKLYIYEENVVDCYQITFQSVDLPEANVVGCYQITFESVNLPKANVVDCYQITFESVDLPEEGARNTVVQMNKALACIHSYFHWNTNTITANTIANTYFHSFFH